jgi:hypothetical protein
MTHVVTLPSVGGNEEMLTRSTGSLARAHDG